MKKRTTLLVITTDGSRWEVVQPSGWWPLANYPILWGRPFGTEGEYNWRIAADHVVAYREEKE